MRRAWESGQRVEKFIGFDATEDHRSKKTYAADNGKDDVCPMPGVPHMTERYNVRYPLREWGMNRDACGKTITDAGLPLPPKSACFFCGAMKEWEIKQLIEQEPELHLLALEMERLYRSNEKGFKFKGDDYLKVKGTHKETGEEYTIEGNWPGDTEKDRRAAARRAFRLKYNDTVRPYRYELDTSKAVVGLGRRFAWESIRHEAPT